MLMMSKRKILQINAYYGVGSTGNIVREIVAEGKRQGFEMYAIYWLQPNSFEDKNVYYLGYDKNKSPISKMIEWIFKGGKLSYNQEITEKIIKVIMKINPDIIHLHNLHGDFEYGTLDLKILFQFLSEYNKKVIWTLHDCWPITGRCYHFEYKNCEKWRIGCGNCPQRLFDLEGILYDYSDKNWKTKNELYSCIDDLTVVTVSNWLNFIVKQSMLKSRKVVTIYNGVNTDIFYPRKKSELESKFRILCIGWDRRKGYKDYYKLAKLLSEDEEILVVGKRPFFRKNKKLPHNIIEIDRGESAEQMAAIYEKADIYFNASPAETFGLTTAEALASGIPVVAYNNTATTEVVELIEGKQGLVKTGDVQAVYKVITLIKKQRGSVKDFHEKCKEHFHISEMLKKYMELYGVKE